MRHPGLKAQVYVVCNTTKLVGTSFNYVPGLGSPTAVLILWKYLVHGMPCIFGSCRSLSTLSAQCTCVGLGLLSSFLMYFLHR